MSRAMRKSQKLIKRLIEAASARALRGSRPLEEFDQIDEDLFLAEQHLQYYVDTLEKNNKRLEGVLADIQRSEL